MTARTLARLGPTCSALLVSALIVPACTIQPSSAPTERPLDYASLVETLRRSATVVESDETVNQPFFSVPARIIRLIGEDVQVFEYRDATAAQAEAQRVSPDGGRIGSYSALWLAPPHFYKRDRVIALYLGDTAAVMNALQIAIGLQFAGRSS